MWESRKPRAVSRQGNRIKIGHCRQRKSPIHTETINGEDASSSPCAKAVKINFDASPDFNHLVLYQEHMRAGKA